MLSHLPSKDCGKNTVAAVTHRTESGFIAAAQHWEWEENVKETHNGNEQNEIMSINCNQLYLQTKSVFLSTLCHLLHPYSSFSFLFVLLPSCFLHILTLYNPLFTLSDRNSLLCSCVFSSPSAKSVSSRSAWEAFPLPNSPCALVSLVRY